MAASGMHATIPLGQLRAEVVRLQRLTADAELEVTTRTGRGDTSGAATWTTYRDVYRTERDEAVAQLSSRFSQSIPLGGS